jgi:hypothetical protein
VGSGFRRLREQALQGALHKQRGAATQALIFLAQLVALASPTTKCRPHRAASDCPFIDPHERARYDFPNYGICGECSSARLEPLRRGPLSEIWTHGRPSPARRQGLARRPHGSPSMPASIARIHWRHGSRRARSRGAVNPRSRTRRAAKARGFTAGRGPSYLHPAPSRLYAQKRRGTLAGWRGSIGNQ